MDTKGNLKNTHRHGDRIGAGIRRISIFCIGASTSIGIGIGFSYGYRYKYKYTYRYRHY